MNYTKGVGVFIIQNNKLLLLKRKKEPFAGFWEVPAGKLDPGENFEDTVKREVKEKIDLKVKPLKEIGININKEKSFESHIFKASVISGTINNNEPDKHAEIKFFDLDNLPNRLGSTTKKGLELINYKKYENCNH